MAARDATVPTVGEVGVADARGAVGRGLDVLARDSGFDEVPRDRLGKIERRLAAGMGVEEPGVEFTRHLRTDREAAGAQARADRGAERFRPEPFQGNCFDRVSGNPLARAAPAAVKKRASGTVLRHDRHGRAIGGRDGHPGIERAYEKAVRLARSLPRLDEHASMNLMDENGAALLESGRHAKPPAVLADGPLLVADSQTEIERGKGAAAHAALSTGHAEPSARGEGSGAGLPNGNRVRFLFRRSHRAHIALRALAAQAVCAGFLLTGCAHAPTPTGGAEARSRFLDLFAKADSATRGAGMLSIERGRTGRKGLNTSWAAYAESIVVAAYVGPIRTIDASILGDSLYLAMRPYDLGLAGPLPREAGLGPRGLLFLARPWAFDAPWVRDALTRATVEAVAGGWRITGALESADGQRPFILELNSKSDPRLLEIGRAVAGGAWIRVRYGPARRFQDSRIPRWIEWTKDETRIRLDIEDHARAKPSQLRHPPPPKAEWTILALDDPRGRDLLRRWLSVGEEEQP